MAEDENVITPPAADVPPAPAADETPAQPADESAADTPPAPPADDMPPAPPADVPPAPAADAPPADGAAEQTNETVDAPAPEQPQPEDAPADVPSDMKPPVLDTSRTGFADLGLRPGDACTCPDGRPGTVHTFAGNPLICIPNQG